MKNNIKVIISTFGPLHLLKSADVLSNKVDIQVIQGWIPKCWNRWMLKLVSKIVGRDLTKTFTKRTPRSLLGRNHSVGLPEFYLWACRLFKLQSPMKYSDQAAKLYGRLSKKYIHNANIFHVRSGSGFSGAIEKAKAQGMKTIVDHSIVHPAYMDKKLRKEYERNGTIFDLGMDNPFWNHIVDECHKGDVLLVNSEFVKRTFVENGFSEDKIEVITQGVRKDFIGLKKDYKLHEDGMHILFTGGFGFRKGAEYILRALCILDEEGYNYEFTAVGDSSSASPLLEKFKPKHIHLVSTVPQPELKEYLSNSDAYLFPSLCEGCASSGLEAMAAGLPVIATEESGLPIVDNESGKFVQSMSADDIVNAIKYVGNSYEYRRKIGKGASKLISESYTWDMYAEKLVTLYNNLLN